MYLSCSSIKVGSYRCCVFNTLVFAGIDMVDCLKQLQLVCMHLQEQDRQNTRLYAHKAASAGGLASQLQK